MDWGIYYAVSIVCLKNLILFKPAGERNDCGFWFSSKTCTFQTWAALLRLVSTFQLMVRINTRDPNPFTNEETLIRMLPHLCHFWLIVLKILLNPCHHSPRSWWNFYAFRQINILLSDKLSLWWVPIYRSLLMRECPSPCWHKACKENTAR
jgi:hypothetical protein